MDVNGKEFIRNLEIEQEKEELHKQALRLDAEKRKAVKPSSSTTQTPSYFDDNFDQQINIDQKEDIVDLKIENATIDDNDLMQPLTTSNKKKKYLILGVALVLLFIITILALRLASNKQTEQELVNNDTKQIQQNEILNKIDTNEQYQDDTDQKRQAEQKNINRPTQEQNLNDIPLPKVEDTPIVIDTPKKQVEQKRDLFGLNGASAQSIKKPIEKTVKHTAKKVIKPVVKKVIKPRYKTHKKVVKKAIATNNTKGYFIQIGAYSKQPSKKLLNSIGKKGYDYQIKKVNIKGRFYNKVLIGAYTTRASAKKMLRKVRADFRNPNAYILRF